MKIALLISTFNWPEALDLVLRSVVRQSRLPDEVLIADDGSDERTGALIDCYAGRLPIKHVWHEDEGFRKTIVLNKAIQQATSPYIIEIDGDIVLHRHFIKDHLKAAERGYFVQGSRAMIGERKTAQALANKQLDFSFFTKEITCGRFNAIRCPKLSGIFHTDSLSSRKVKGCNLAFWRADYIKVNGYYNGFEGWGWEDTEFGERLINAGIRKNRLKWAAVGYHLFHRLSPRSNFEPNKQIYEESVTHKLAYRGPGYRQTPSPVTV
ncbi:glycosyltransferase family 2 protein [Parapedobacter tibetensis]|uniref:glycosyltransferase family 2 protein n=1 Tax=Parapedobacter tibetensis TaxID=2972951 RepID=UPI00214D9C29|nr:glycosyltransferase family 2 protein [Parapedobacter tibetensis]